MKSIASILLAGLALSFSTGVASAADDPFGEPIAQASGWKQSAWFGWYVDSFYPFVIHAQHEWVYVYPQGDWVWLWDYSLNEWFATGGTTYPMLYEPTGNKWMWYYTGTKGPRWYVDMESSEVYTEFSDCLMPSLMKSTFETSVGLSDDSGELGNLMSEGLGIALLAIAGDPATSVCPVITRTPETVDLFDPPASILASVNFGDGCTPEDGTGEIAGSLDVNISDLLFGETGIGLSLELTANNLMRDGLALLNGSLSAAFSIGIFSEESETATHYVTRATTTLNGDLTFTDLQSLDAFISGAVSLSGDILAIEQESKADWDDVTESTEGTLTITMDAFSTDELDITSGLVTLDINMPGTTTVDADMQTSDGPVDLTLVIEQSEDGSLVTVNTDGTATVFGYTMTISNMVMDETQCEDYPVSGVFTISYDGIDYVITMTGNCDGTYIISKG
jgi:hypothetical protein